MVFRVNTAGRLKPPLERQKEAFENLLAYKMQKLVVTSIIEFENKNK